LAPFHSIPPKEKEVLEISLKPALIRFTRKHGFENDEQLLNIYDKTLNFRLLESTFCPHIRELADQEMHPLGLPIAPCIAFQFNWGKTTWFLYIEPSTKIELSQRILRLVPRKQMTNDWWNPNPPICAQGRPWQQVNR